MEILFDINQVAFKILSYNMSWLELIGTISGIACVWLTAKEKIICWPIGIVNIVFFFILFYQVRLYSDMVLQTVFFILSFYGWYAWLNPKTKKEENINKELKITLLSNKQRVVLGFMILVLTLILGMFMIKIHLIFPKIFPEPAAAPFRDSFTTVASVTAQWIMARKKLESWILWIIIDVVAFIYYFQVGIAFVGLEYILFLGLAIKGFYEWRKEQIKSNVLTLDEDLA